MVFPVLWRTHAPSMWDEAFSARRELDRMLDRVVSATAPGFDGTMWAPPVDVRETKDDIRVQVELPGLDPENVDVQLENGVLRISGDKKQSLEEGAEEGGYHLIERRYGRFERSFQVPASVDASKVTAKFEHGVLTIHLPKVETAKPRRVAVEVSSAR
jgi:HSP20 family protein